MSNKKTYDKEYKIQAVKLGKEIGQAKAAKELGISSNTLYTWTKKTKEGTLDLGPGSQTPQSAIDLFGNLREMLIIVNTSYKRKTHSKTFLFVSIT